MKSGDRIIAFGLNLSMINIGIKVGTIYNLIRINQFTSTVGYVTGPGIYNKYGVGVSLRYFKKYDPPITSIHLNSGSELIIDA